MDPRKILHDPNQMSNYTQNMQNYAAVNPTPIQYFMNANNQMVYNQNQQDANNYQSQYHLMGQMQPQSNPTQQQQAALYMAQQSLQQQQTLQQQQSLQQLNNDAYLRQRANIRPPNSMSNLYQQGQINNMESGRKVSSLDNMPKCVSNQSELESNNLNINLHHSIKTIFTNALNKAAAESQGRHLMLMNYIRSLMESRMDINTFISILKNSRCQDFTNDQIQILKEYFNLRTSSNQNDTSHNINQSKVVKISSSTPQKQIHHQRQLPQKHHSQQEQQQIKQQVSQQQSQSQQQLQQHAISSMNQNVRIPQLTVMQNSQPSTSITSNVTRMSQSVRPQQQPQTLSSLFPEAGFLEFLRACPDPPPFYVEKEPINEEDAEVEFDIGGVNLQEEESIMSKISCDHDSMLGTSESIFNNNRIVDIITCIRGKYGLDITDESTRQMTNIISYALEIKLRQILHQATLQVHHRLNNYSFKGRTHVVLHPEQSFGFMEEVISTRTAKKGIDKAKNKGKEQEKRLMKIADEGLKISASNAMVMAAVKGSRKIENFQLMIDEEQKGSHSTTANASLHQRMRYSAVKQRKISARDIFQIFESDPILRKAIFHLNLFMKL